jgi:hypothetical protein
MALTTLDLVVHDDARPAFPAAHVGGHTLPSYGELAGLAGGSERVLPHGGKAPVQPPQRIRECGADGYLTSAFRGLLG